MEGDTPVLFSRMTRRRWVPECGGPAASPWALEKKGRGTLKGQRVSGWEKREKRTPLIPLISKQKQNANALIVTRLAWMAHRLVSSNRWTIKSSVA